MDYPSFVNNKWIVWKSDLKDVSIQSLQIGSLVYARCILNGMSEAKSHQLAEKAVFEEYYRVKY
jgi:hypothetical protein